MIPTDNEIADRFEEENQGLRKQLWLRHGHSGPALYGDDGEMQCKACRLDYKRDPVKTILARLHQGDLDRACDVSRNEPLASDNAEMVEKLRGALQPFATFAEDMVDADGWNDVGIGTSHDRIVDWFGPSDFWRARTALAESEAPECQHPKIENAVCMKCGKVLLPEPWGDIPISPATTEPASERAWCCSRCHGKSYIIVNGAEVCGNCCPEEGEATPASEPPLPTVVMPGITPQTDITNFTTCGVVPPQPPTLDICIRPCGDSGPRRCPYCNCDLQLTEPGATKDKHGNVCHQDCLDKARGPKPPATVTVPAKSPTPPEIAREIVASWTLCGNVRIDGKVIERAITAAIKQERLVQEQLRADRRKQGQDYARDTEYYLDRIAKLERQLKDDGPGTPLGILKGIDDFAVTHCGYNLLMAKPAVAVVLEHFLKLEDDLRLQRQASRFNADEHKQAVEALRSSPCNKPGHLQAHWEERRKHDVVAAMNHRYPPPDSHFDRRQHDLGGWCKACEEEEKARRDALEGLERTVRIALVRNAVQRFRDAWNTTITYGEIEAAIRGKKT